MMDDTRAVGAAAFFRAVRLVLLDFRAEPGACWVLVDACFGDRSGRWIFRMRGL